LKAVYEPENRYDPNAIALYFGETKIGFVPREHNHLIAKLIRLGYKDIFQFTINRVVADAHPEKQIFIIVRFKEAAEKR
jgi:hypothetical protein